MLLCGPVHAITRAPVPHVGTRARAARPTMVVMETFDVVVLGAGSGGETVASELAEGGLRVAVVEQGLVGGECPYVACVPSKTLLLAAAAGVSWEVALRRRDAAAEHRDDSGAARGLEEAGVTVVRGRGTVTGQDRLSVDGRDLAWSRGLVVGTGSEPVVPPVPGLDRAPTWTSDEALTRPELPGRLAVLGGGAVGCELSQVYARFGSRVTLLEPARTLLGGEPDWAGGMLCEALRADGVDVRLGTAAARVEPVAGGVRVVPERGEAVEVDRVLVATGRRPRTNGIGLETLDVRPEDGAPLPVDERCRVRRGDGVLPGVFAVGDVTGVSPYTHTANYQARIVAAHLLGRDARDADYRAIPRAVYTDPTVFSVGLSADAARESGVEVAVARSDVRQTGRAFVEGAAAGGPAPAARLELVADRAAGHLLGAVAVGPDADSWASELALAVHARVPLTVLVDLVHAFPTWGEAILPPLQELSYATATRAAAITSGSSAG